MAELPTLDHLVAVSEECIRWSRLWNEPVGVQLVGLLSGSIVGPRCHQCSKVKVYGTPGAPVTSTRLSMITGLTTGTDYWNGLMSL